MDEQEFKVFKDKFFSKVQANENGCWIWLGSKTTDGYGTFSYKGRSWRAHKLLWIMFHGEEALLGGKILHHLCEIKLCINDEHLKPVTPAEHTKEHAKTWPMLRMHAWITQLKERL